MTVLNLCIHNEEFIGLGFDGAVDLSEGPVYVLPGQIYILVLGCSVLYSSQPPPLPTWVSTSHDIVRARWVVGHGLPDD